jgi:hypothetical protein
LKQAQRACHMPAPTISHALYLMRYSSTGESPGTGTGSVGALPCFLALAHLAAARARSERRQYSSSRRTRLTRSKANKPQFKTLKTRFFYEFLTAQMWMWIWTYRIPDTGGCGLWLDWPQTCFRVFGPSFFNTALQLVLRPHFLVRFVWYDLLAIWFGPELSSLVLG